MNEKIKYFMAKEKTKRTIEKEIYQLKNQQVWDEYKYQGTEGGTQEELNKITASYGKKINILNNKIETL